MQPLRFMVSWLREAKGRMAGSLTLSMGTALASTAMMATAGYLISASALEPPTILMLWVPIVAVRFFGTSRAALRYLDRLVSHDAILRLAARLRARVYAYLDAHPGAWAGRRTSEALDLILADMDRVQNLVLRVVLPFASACGASALSAVWLWRIHETLGLAFVAGAALASIVLPALVVGLTARWEKARNEVRRDRLAAMDDLARGLEELLAHGLAARALGEMEALEAKENRLALRIDLAKAAAEGALYAAAMTTVALVTGEAARLHVAGQLPGPMVAAVALCTVASFEPWTALGAAYADLQAMAQSVSRLADTVSARGPKRMAAPRPPEPQAQPAPPSPSATGGQGARPSASSSPTSAHRVPQDIVLSARGLSCRRGDVWAVRGVDLDLRRGQRVAIVGDSGAGKTTLAEALLGLVHPEAGDVFWFGRRLSALADTEFRQRVTVVPQDGYVFHTTLRQNLLLARPDARDDDLAHALAVAQLGDLVARLPMGLDTWVGDRGHALSGGERQRIALARAVLRGAEVVVCDEPTASLDVETERAFIEAFFRAMEGRAVLWITHRMTGLERMDEILVMQGGRVVERGAHRELWQRGGVYRKLWEFGHDGALASARAFSARSDAPAPRPPLAGQTPT
ncbi:thiol reductant ABC exporter subunit CydC [Alicyclobacillus vulcanalis]|uniref:ATP-binding cassette, subfamily C, CydC/ATP-binding cassette, subfamily C, CydCD n=1 Tax=Alicyclobacillus vulcanalis TaxID=252246 RepID=A0A1N7KW98_9BACL|nr:thiol reductant ABC exporter subunit CydC [Alicyclobacillus vulcanalis]SIS65844.1 ATP-binding cassette, subfamily C, CydC/ATP-binding cassette, subfamily C, CydCD [Alicyclobacillus vulcanalis]